MSWDQDQRNKSWSISKRETFLMLKYSHLTQWCGCSRIKNSSNKQLKSSEKEITLTWMFGVLVFTIKILNV